MDLSAARDKALAMLVSTELEFALVHRDTEEVAANFPLQTLAMGMEVLWRRNLML